MKQHRLIIDSLSDAQAHCSCGGWYMAFTGVKLAQEIRVEYEKHLKYMEGKA